MWHDLNTFLGLDDSVAFSRLDDLINFSALDSMYVLSGPDSPNNLSILNSMDCFSGLHRLAVLDSLSDALDDLDDLAVKPSLLTICALRTSSLIQ